MCVSRPVFKKKTLLVKNPPPPPPKKKGVFRTWVVRLRIDS
eukprot:COSAG06_NODE_11616_length_1485_cov_1.500722_1_plen_40_part_10